MKERRCREEDPARRHPEDQNRHTGPRGVPVEPDMLGRYAFLVLGAAGPPAGHILGSISAPVSPRW